MIGCDPTARLETSNAALVTPAALVVNRELPRRRPPALKETEPVGSVPDTGVTSR